jgi:hypothetical protein
MKTQVIRTTVMAAAALLAVVIAACQKSEVVAPDGSTLTLAATPAVIVTSGGEQTVAVTILATVRDTIGVPLPGQDVRFTTTSGLLTPQAGLPVATDEIGNATTILTKATTATTIAATSGKATANVQLQTVSCNISSIAVDPSQITFTSCDTSVDGSGSFTLTATVADTTQQPCAGVVVTFNSKSTVTPLPTGDITFVISPGSGSTDAAGQVQTKVTLNSADCSSKCTGKDCNTSKQTIVATAGAISATGVTVVTQVN